MIDHMRLLAGIRLSRHRGDQDPTTSPPRQRADIKDYTSENSMRVVHWAEDLDVSAISLNPFQRPQIGAWLTPEMAPAYDGIIFSMMDRGIRHQNDLNDLGRFALEHRKVIIIVKSPMGGAFVLDFRRGPLDPITQLTATFLAFGAQMEAVAMVTRNRNRAAFLRAAGKWSGGGYPFYLMPVRDEGGNYTFMLNPEYVPVANEMVSLGLENKSDTEIATELNQGNILSPWEQKIQRDGKYSKAPFSGTVVKISEEELKIESPTGEAEFVAMSPKRGRWCVGLGDRVKEGDRLNHKILWSSAGVKKVLTSRYLIGEDEDEDGGALLDNNGQPIQICEPLLTDRAVWDRLQSIRAGRAQKSHTVRKDASLLLNVLRCAQCGNLCYSHHSTKGKYVYKYYRCKGKSDPRCGTLADGACKASVVRMEPINKLVGDALIATVGKFYIQKRVFIPGESHAAEIAELGKALADIIKETAGQEEVVKKVYEKQRLGVIQRMTYLSAIPETDDRWELQTSGETYREVWERSSVEAKRKLLLDSGIVAYCERRKTVSRNRTVNLPGVDPDVMLVQIAEDNDHVVFVCIPKDITKRSLGRAQDLGYRDQTLWGEVRDVPLALESQDLSTLV